MANPIKIIKNGIINENPTFVQVIGMCPTLAVTSSAINGIGMGLSTTAVLIFANLFISLLRKVIPDTVRIPCFIVVIASIRNNQYEFLLKALSACTERIPGSVHSTDRSKLSDSWRVPKHSLPKMVPLLPHSMVSVWVLVSPSLWACLGLVREFLGSGTLFGRNSTARSIP